jgi:hypothetical protein
MTFKSKLMPLRELKFTFGATAVIVLLAACIGLIIVKVVDARLKDISINMPTVNLPTINISLPTDLVGGAGVSLGAARFKPADNLFKYQKQTGGSPTDTIAKANDENTEDTQGIIKPDVKIPNVQDLSADCKNRTRFIASRYESAKDARVYTGITPQPSVDHQSRPAPWSSLRPALETAPEPRSLGFGLTYYLDPKNMTPDQIQKFKLKAKFEKMTVQDYTNWLNLFVNTPEQLTAFHRANLRIIARGGTLSKTDMPHETPLPSTAEQDYFKKISNGSQMNNIPQPEYLGYQPYNMDQAAVLSPPLNRNLRHLDFVNPDEPLKTWELTRVSSKISSKQA